MSDPMPNPNDDAREPNGKLKRKEYEREKLPHSGVELPKRQDRGDSEESDYAFSVAPEAL